MVTVFRFFRSVRSSGSEIARSSFRARRSRFVKCLSSGIQWRDGHSYTSDIAFAHEAWSNSLLDGGNSVVLMWLCAAAHTRPLPRATTIWASRRRRLDGAGTTRRTTMYDPGARIVSDFRPASRWSSVARSNSFENSRLSCSRPPFTNLSNCAVLNFELAPGETRILSTNRLNSPIGSAATACAAGKAQLRSFRCLSATKFATFLVMRWFATMLELLSRKIRPAAESRNAHTLVGVFAWRLSDTGSSSTTSLIDLETHASELKALASRPSAMILMISAGSSSMIARRAMEGRILTSREKFTRPFGDPKIFDA